MNDLHSRKTDTLEVPTSLSEIEQQGRDRERQGPVEQRQAEESERQRIAAKQAQAQRVAQQKKDQQGVRKVPLLSQQLIEIQLRRAQRAQLKIAEQQQEIQDAQNQQQGNRHLTSQERQQKLMSAATQTNDSPMDQNGQPTGNPDTDRYTYQERLLHIRHHMSQRYIPQYGPPNQYPPDIAREYGPGLERTAKAWVPEVMQRERQSGRPDLDFPTTDQTYDNDDDDHLIDPM
ncbi:unnamed protein product [Penicillium viridicatum]